MLSRAYQVLEHPSVYRLAQWILAPGDKFTLHRHMRRLLGTLPEGKRLLDLGCGPDSWLLRQHLAPTGLDVSRAYVAEFARKGHPGVVASADALPFSPASFDGIWSVGLFHHLPDEAVLRVMAECAAVCRPGGYLAFLDAVLPRRPLRRPLAYWIRRADRGRFMRTEEQLRALLHPTYRWAVERHTYTLTGMEFVACLGRCETPAPGAPT